MANNVALVGFDDVPLAQQTGLLMSTVRQPLREMGGTAADVLVRQLDEGLPAETEVVIPTSLVVRHTTVRL
jgi:LacI family transcriptional regulator